MPGPLPRLPAAILASFVGGILAVYAIGIPVLAWRADMTLLQACAASLVFLPGDLIKAVAAGLLAEAASRSLPDAIAGRG